LSKNRKGVKGVVSSPSRVRGGAPTVERFSCILRFRGHLILLYVIKVKSPTDGTKEVIPSPWKAGNYMSRGGYQL